jgi:uncharacterized membrane protein YphA (DoxX/SURF4 family)
MTIGTLMLMIGIAAVALMFLTGIFTDRLQNKPLSFLQFFSGVLFVVSGAVKAIDPLGTAYKMAQYFAAFEGVFKPTAASWLSPLFPWLSQFTEGFAVGMIVLEIALGIGLIIGFMPRLTAWIFLLLVLFFTVLTGFTYLTGYVPSEVNFFEFGKWGKYVATNMKVTDCGCFGDFIKLEPKVSFIKDLVLLVPALAFVFLHSEMHRLFNPVLRNWVTGLSVPALMVYCFSNYVWNLPDIDFRPFKEGVNIGEKKRQEQEALQNVKITAYRLTNKSDGRVLEIPFDKFLKEMSKYPTESWEMEQIKSKPAIAPTKVSEFEVSNLEGQEVTEELLSMQGYYFLVIAHHLEGEPEEIRTTVRDTVYLTDSTRTANSLEILPQMKVVEGTRTTKAFKWEAAYQERWTDGVVPLAEAAAKAEINTVAITAYADKSQIGDFREKIGANFPFLVADDILLKTIIRSNPGVLLFKDGTIVKMWHHRKLPTFQEIKEQYIRK